MKTTEPLLTIITPTFNRADKLPTLFESLAHQTNHDFIWLIVDDGSTDNTEKVVDGFAPNEFDIIYLEKSNGGKHTALNKGIRETNTVLTMIVDSDDYLMSDAVEQIKYYYNKYRGVSEIHCYSFNKGRNANDNFVKIPQREFVDSYIHCRIKQSRPGDRAEVFFTEELKSHPFPVFNGEKFLSEDVVWIAIGLHSRCVFVDRTIYICEYLKNGLTANDKPAKFASPQGSMLRGKLLMTKECGWKANLKGAIIYDAYRHVKMPSDQRLSLSKREQLLTVLCKPIGYYYYKKWGKIAGQ